jgi:NitT/TauT family transport system permease protein
MASEQQSPAQVGRSSNSRGRQRSGSSKAPEPVARWRRSAWRSAAIYLAIPAIGLPVIASTSGGFTAGGIAAYFPQATVDLSYSFVRMLAAYLASLGFSLVYGYYAATHHTGEKVMIPVLDILQSVPILGFFPVAIVFFVALTPNSFIGPNLASIFLIFTSMAWNMVFGVYESIKTLPNDLKESASSFGVRGMQRFREVLFPATVNRLVYNTVLSWTAGWFFLVEAEIFSTNNSSVTLLGIGSFLSHAASPFNGNAFAAGLIVLVILIAALDFLLWRPLGQWAEKYRYDQTPSGESDEVIPSGGSTRRFRRAAVYVAKGVRTTATRLGTPFISLAAFTQRAAGTTAQRPMAKRAARWVPLASVLIICWLLLIAIVVAVFHVFTGPITPYIRGQILLLPAAMGLSALRVVAAFLVCLAIALPLAWWITKRPHAARVGLPVIEIVASFPATALFPFIIFVILPYITGEGAAILMLMTGMIWYLFFNLLSGMRAIPPDLQEASRSYGLTNRQYFRRVVLPGTFPAFITGAITAFGGGWNTLIVAEYLTSGTRSFSVPGVGELLDKGAGMGGVGAPLMTAALFTLVFTVIAINEVFWKPMYRRAVEKYRYD